MERDCESELSKLNIEQNACIYHFGASVIHGQRSNILRLHSYYRFIFFEKDRSDSDRHLLHLLLPVLYPIYDGVGLRSIWCITKQPIRLTEPMPAL